MTAPRVGSEPADAPTRALALAGPGGQMLGSAWVQWTSRHDGPMGDPTGSDPTVGKRRAAVVDRPWTWLRQVHGAGVVVVDRPGGSAGCSADAAVSAVPGVALAVLTADCAPVAFASPEGVIGVAHAGWRGLIAGVIEATVSAMGGLGATSIVASVGPCIHAGCYAFGAADLDAMASAFGPAVRSVTSDGRAALDVPTAVRVAVERAGASLVSDAGVCTACSTQHWSWRARQDRDRQATVAWRP
jgi:YfiH family protein